LQGRTAAPRIAAPPPGAAEAKLSAKGTIVTTPVPAVNVLPRPSPEVQAKLDSLETRIDDMGSRATAANNSLNTMQRSLQKDQMNLRGDIVTRQASMNNNLAKAKEAFRDKDANRAERFANLTESDLSALEAFLGR